MTITITPSNADAITKTAAVTISEASSGTSGASTSGGGGGGGGGGTNTYEKGNLVSAVTQSLAKGDVVKFSLQGQPHHLKLTDLTNKTATFNLSSVTETFTLTVGQEKKKDFDGDGSFDVSIILKSITGSKANVTLTPLAGAVSPLPAGKAGEVPQAPGEEGTGPEAETPAIPSPPPEGAQETAKGEETVYGRLDITLVIALLLILTGTYLIAWSKWKKNKKQEK